MPRYTPTTTTITSRFQMNIPVAIREQINLDKSTTAEIWTEDGVILVRPHYPKIMELAGVLRDRKSPLKIPGLKKDMSNIRDFIDYSDL